MAIEGEPACPAKFGAEPRCLRLGVPLLLGLPFGQETLQQTFNSAQRLLLEVAIGPSTHDLKPVSLESNGSPTGVFIVVRSLLPSGREELIRVLSRDGPCGPSHRDFESRATQGGIPGLGSGFDEAELCFRQPHLAADCLRPFCIQIKANEHFPVPFVDTLQDSSRNFIVFMLDSPVLGIRMMIGQNECPFEIGVTAPLFDSSFNVSGHLPPHYSSHEAHEPRGVPQLPPLDGLRHDHK